jgi:Tol biopolymer transport system component
MKLPRLENRILPKTLIAIAVALVVLLYPLRSSPVAALAGTSAQPATTQSPIKSITTLVKDAGRVDWSSKNVIAFDRKGADGYFDIFSIRPDGSGERCLTCDRPELPNRQIGNPAWHPSGEYIAFQVQRGGFRGAPRLTDFFANPGSGVANDVWVMDADGTRFTQITHVGRGFGGVLHPHFSSDGRQLLWAERIASKGGKWGLWALKVGDFSVNNGKPSVQRIRTFQPGRQHRFYESHGFDTAGRRVLFSGNLDADQDETGLDIYWMDLSSGDVRNLTSTPREWDEHAHLSPSGRHIVWISSRDILGWPINPVEMRADYWLMNADGSGQQRLTYFNKEGSREYVAGGAVAADNAWSPDGRRLAAYVMTDTRRVAGPLMIIEFTSAQ